VGWPVLLTALLAIAGCSARWTEEQVNGLRHLATAEVSGRGGRVRVKVPVLEGETAMLFTADAEPDHKAVFLGATSPGGDKVYDVDTEWASGVEKTGARYATDVVSLNWPILRSDAPLDPGRWTVDLGLVDSDLNYQRGVSADLDVVLEQDPDFSGGTLGVRLVFAGATQDDATVKDAVHQAVDTWKTLYAQIGVDLVVTEGTWPDGQLTKPGETSGDAYASISAETALGTVTVVIVDGIEGSPDIFGVAGGIPGPLVPTAYSVVTVAALTHAGGDGVFDAEEIRLLAETMAHETGHFLGLFHPVEQTWDAWDAVDDTPQCDSQASCIQALGSNLMFPYPLCTTTSCRPQDELTPGQGAVVNRYAGVL